MTPVTAFCPFARDAAGRSRGDGAVEPRGRRHYRPICRHHSSKISKVQMRRLKSRPPR